MRIVRINLSFFSYCILIRCGGCRRLPALNVQPVYAGRAGYEKKTDRFFRQADLQAERQTAVCGRGYKFFNILSVCVFAAAVSIYGLTNLPEAEEGGDVSGDGVAAGNPRKEL